MRKRGKGEKHGEGGEKEELGIKRGKKHMQIYDVALTDRTDVVEHSSSSWYYYY